jgi:hypothetical protein
MKLAVHAGAVRHARTALIIWRSHRARWCQAPGEHGAWAVCGFLHENHNGSVTVRASVAHSLITDIRTARREGRTSCRERTTKLTAGKRAIAACAAVVAFSGIGLATGPPIDAFVGDDAVALDAVTFAQNGSAEPTGWQAQVGAPAVRPAPIAPTRIHPLRRRRRIHFWFGNHSGTGIGGPLSWLIALPLILLSLGGVALAVVLRRRRRGRTAASPAVESYVHNPEDVTKQRLRTLSELHVSGELTDAEFEHEKRRIIGDGAP